MAKRMALCLDEMTCRNPEIVGLEGEPVGRQPWVEVFTAGQEARNAVAEGNIDEAWVVSSDDVEPINLAATMKSDCPDLRVCLVALEPCGSLFSRANIAEIDEVIDLKAFLARYAATKRDWVGFDSADAGGLAGSSVAQATAAAAAPPKAEGQLAAGSAIALAPPEVPAPPDHGSRQPAVQLLNWEDVATPAAATASAHAFMLTIVSGSGGAGKSAVSTLGALVAERMGFRTLLVDCDLQFGDVAAMAGEPGALRIDEAIAHPDKLEREIGLGKRFVVLAAPDRLEVAERVVPQLPGLLDRLSGCFDVIVANTGASWAEQHAVLLERSSAALFLVDQRVSSIRACQHALDLCARCGIATGPFQFALNRCAKGSPLSSTDVSCALQGAPVYELKDGGSNVEDYLSGGAARDLLNMRNEFAKSLEHVMGQVLPASHAIAPAPAIEIENRRLPRRRGKFGSRKRGR